MQPVRTRVRMNHTSPLQKKENDLIGRVSTYTNKYRAHHQLLIHLFWFLNMNKYKPTL